MEKPEKPKGKRVRRGDGQAKDKTIKIKLTTRDSTAIASGQTALSGSEDEDEPEAAVEEHLILRLPAGQMCERLRESVRKREVPEDVRLHMKG